MDNKRDKSKFTVVIPTMWRSEFTPELLRSLEHCTEVGEVIIIDNNFLNVKLPSISKMRYFTKGKNIYVNPSWNWGVELAKYENVCLLNDDLVLDTSIFKYVEPYLKGRVIGMHSDNYYLEKSEIPTIYKIKERTWAWGCCIFVKKETYKPIPDCLKIACGDDYLIKVLPAYSVRGFKVTTRVSTTSLQVQFLPIQEQDLINFKAL